MFGLRRSSRPTETIVILLLLGCFACSSGCGGPESTTIGEGGSSDTEPPPERNQPSVSPSSSPAEDDADPPEFGESGNSPFHQPPPSAETPTDAEADRTASDIAGEAPAFGNMSERNDSPNLAASSASGEHPASTNNRDSDEIDNDNENPSLDELLANLDVPPRWLDSVETSYDTSQPWKEARLEIRRLLSFGKQATHREAIKLTWDYLQKGDIGDGHEYPMYTFLGGEPIWSIRAHEEFIKKPHEHTPIHAYVTLTSLYAQYGEFAKAKAILDKAMSGLPDPPWRIMRKADLLAAYGDLYAAWGKVDEAKESYAQAATLYPTSKPPYGAHLLPRRAAGVQSKLDLLTFRSLATATLRDGQYDVTALGYANDIYVTVSIENGRIADVQLKHEEKIDQNACVIVPQEIVERQSLQVDAITGATVTVDAIVDGVYRALRQAGLE